MKIAHIKGLCFRIPNDKIWYSFFNSPYLGHKHGTAIDVYYPDRALFPFEEGRVTEIRKIKTPRNVPFIVDYLVLVKVKDYYLKILHVNPSVKEGERLYFGDDIGRLIVSGFFKPWSDIHAHFELRDKLDRYRARGGFLTEPLVQELIPSIKGNGFEVVEKKEHYYWLKPIRTGKRHLTPLIYKNTPVEGGLPYYQYGAVFGNMAEVEIFGTEIKTHDRLASNVNIFKTSLEVYSNDQKIKGIGVYCNQNKIKLVGGEFREGEIVQLVFN